MMQLCFQGMQLDIPLSVSRDTLLMIIEVAAHAQMQIFPVSATFMFLLERRIFEKESTVFLHW